MKTAPWDVADFLDSPEAVVAYLGAAIDEAQNDPGFLLIALETVTRALRPSEGFV